jgi:hypothetical protein
MLPEVEFDYIYCIQHCALWKQFFAVASATEVQHNVKNMERN